MAREGVGIVLAVVGAALGVTGIALLVRERRKQKGLDGPLGKLVGERKEGDMTLKHYSDPLMPIDKRVGIIQDMVWKSVRDPRMRKIALGVTQHCPARDGECEARAIFDYVKRNVRYTGDVAPIKKGKDGPVEGVDYFQSAWRTLEIKGGDCDDHSIEVATILALNGISPKLRVTSPRGSKTYAHIYAIAGLPKNNPTKWIALDTTLPDGKFGQEAPSGKKRDFVA
jgi:hypothetical protein